MGLKDAVKYFYLKKLRFMQNRKTIRSMKIGAGMTFFTGTMVYYMYNANAALDEKKKRKTGSESIVAAAMLGKVSGMGPNVLGEGRSLQDMVDAVEQKATVPYENIRTPRPWEMETEEQKKKYLKRAYSEIEAKLEDRQANRQSEEDRIQEQIRLIRAKNA